MGTVIKNLSKKYKVKGKNNEVFAVCNNQKKSFIFSNSDKINISGDNNKIIFDYSNVGKIPFKIPSGLRIIIKGNNNLIRIEAPIKFSNTSIGETGDNNVFEIGSTTELVRDAKFYTEEGSSIIIGKNCQIKAGGMFIVANNNYINKSKVIIGDNCYFAKDIIIRTSNGHTMLDAVSGKPLEQSEAQDVVIEDNVWITSRCIVLRGAHISKGSIVGANSFVNKKFLEPNLLIAGTPAKVLKQNVTWDCRHYPLYMKELEMKHNEVK